MATLTEMVAAVVVQSSAAAFSHFGVTVDHAAIEPRSAAERRVVARTPRPVLIRREPARIEKASVCPDTARATTTKA